jgi:hypothetical protein
LLFTEEANGRIYRISYTPPAPPKSPDAKASPVLRN